MIISFFYPVFSIICSPDQNPKVICDYVRESLAGRHAPLHTVAYDCSISATNVRIKSKPPILIFPHLRFKVKIQINNNSKKKKLKLFALSILASKISKCWEDILFSCVMLILEWGRFKVGTFLSKNCSCLLFHCISFFKIWRHVNDTLKNEGRI